MIDIVLLNLIFLIIPLVIYLLYMVFENVIGEDGNDIFFCLSIITSIYLISKYSYYFNYSITIINIFLLVSILKKKEILSILISTYLIILFNGNYLVVIGYLLPILLIKINIKDIYKIIIFTIIQIFIGLLLNNNYVVIYNIIYGFSSYIYIYLLNKLEGIVNVYGTLRDVEYEKNLRESLFKITHEIKNPIAVIKGYLDMMDTSNIVKVNKYVPIIKSEIDRCLTLMDDYLNLTKLKLSKSSMDINLLLDEIVDEVNALLIGKRIEFIVDKSDDEIFIEGDYDRLKQVFINIIKNSIESINESGCIKLNLNVDKMININIIDNGIGMTEEVLKRIGEPFFTTKKKGTGLGVKLSKEIINGHDGTIKYYSNLNNGTRVEINFPKKKNS